MRPVPGARPSGSRRAGEDSGRARAAHQPRHHLWHLRYAGTSSLLLQCRASDPSVRPSVRLSVCLSVWLAGCLSVWLKLKISSFILFFKRCGNPKVVAFFSHTVWLDAVASVRLTGLALPACPGEHGGDPKSVAFFNAAGLDYVSCSPLRVPIARLAAAQAAIQQRPSLGAQNDHCQD
jgi:PEP-utilising enzyme, PEP-binding domain